MIMDGCSKAQIIQLKGKKVLEGMDYLCCAQFQIV